MLDGYWTLPLEIQVALGGGYLAHSIAYAGLRATPSPTELALRSLAFGLIGLLALRYSLEWRAPVWLAVTIGIFLSCLAGGLWRRWVSDMVLWVLDQAGISKEDGLPNAWSKLIQHRKLNVTELSVHTSDGRILFHEREAYNDSALMDGMYFGSDGSIVMVVAEEELKDGKTEKREGICDANYGTRLTYIPADQITRVNVRSAPIS